MSSPRCRETGKIQYMSRGSAMFFAHAGAMFAYRCPHCTQWHLTSQVEQLARIRKRGRRS